MSQLNAAHRRLLGAVERLEAALSARDEAQADAATPRGGSVDHSSDHSADLAAEVGRLRAAYDSLCERHDAAGQRVDAAMERLRAMIAAEDSERQADC